MAKHRLDPEIAVRAIMAMEDEMVNDAHARYRSWEHCRKFFTANRRRATVLVIDALQCKE